MEGAGPLQVERDVGAERAAADPAGAAGHLLGRAAGEGEQEHAPGIGAAQHEVGDAVGERAGLAGAGARDDQERRRGRGRSSLRYAESRRLALCRVEVVQVGARHARMG